MSEKRIQFNNIVRNQFPSYVKEEFPLISEFISQYYISQESQGASVDLIQNIDQYLKLNQLTNQIDSVILNLNISFNDDIIYVENSTTGTLGFPDSYGLIEINNEIITYTGKTENSFTGCIRGFSGVTSYRKQNKPEELVFSQSESKEHLKGSSIKNLSILFLKEFLTKLKYQLTPGFQNRNFDSQLNEANFIRQAKDFYTIKGTDESFKILFGALYGEKVKVYKPKEQLFRPSDAQYSIIKNLVVESISGNPSDLLNSTIYQDEYENFGKAYAPISNVESIYSSTGAYYNLSLDANYNRDINVNGAIYGNFSIHPKTKLIKNYELPYSIFVVTAVSNPGTPPPNQVFAINGTTQQTLTLIRGNKYRFDLSNSTNTGHPLIFQTLNGENISPILINGLPGSSGSFVDLIITSEILDETIKYNCSNHNGMGANINLVNNTNDKHSIILDVDSTIGFPNSGELEVIYSDQTIGIVSYTSKSLTQFYGCSGIKGTILDNTNVNLNVFAYGKSFKNQSETIKFRIRSVLSDLIITDDTYYFKSGDTAYIKSLGILKKDNLSNKWIYNIASSYESNSISKISDKTYTISTKDNHNFIIGDIVDISDNSGTKISSNIIDIRSQKTFIVKSQGNLNLNANYNYIINRNLLKVNLNNLNRINSNIQNVYTIDDRFLIASPSLPYYVDNRTGNSIPLNPSNRSTILSGNFGPPVVGSASTDILNITLPDPPWLDHGFYTGDTVYYTPYTNPITNQLNSLGSNFSEGLYFIKRVNSKSIKLANSKSNLYYSKFENVNKNVDLISNKLEFYKFKSKTLQPQNILREISPPVDDGYQYETKVGQTGVLINGVEILNYKSNDNIFYGSIEDIEVISPGSGYDIINPPIINITDLVGTGATGYCAVKGNLKEIKVIDPGFNYTQVPIIKITGGNGIGAKAKPNLKLITYQVNFNSQQTSNLIGIGSTLSTIGFTTYHKFENAEKIIYKTNGQVSVGGLSTNSSYYVNVKDLYTVKLHNTLNDSISGINTISLTSYGVGNHIIESYEKKYILESINVEDSGIGYENKKRTCISSGINTALNLINIKNHDYKSGEIITYNTEYSPISGLSTNTNYYITKIDDNSFKLSLVGTGLTNTDVYYKKNQYIDLLSVGVGTHTFNYPEISVEVIGSVGILPINNETFKAKLQPIFKGVISSIHLSSNGSGYGSAEILNYYREPNIHLNSGSGAQLNAILSDGKIVDVIVNKTGNGYNSLPSLFVNGSGFGANLTAIIENEQIKSVKILNGGNNYIGSSINIDVISSGENCLLRPNLQTWRVNLFQKYLNTFKDDDGIVTTGLNNAYELQYTHLYAPRKLRELVYSLDQNGKNIYGKPDLLISNNSEISSFGHSPIIGWAYDGNPIYGPYGYAKKQGSGVVSQMKSGYVIDIKENRPSTDKFDQGFFIEDYTYYPVQDETVLDENNGRFCVTPEFPNGTYAYFSTLEIITESDGPFKGYKKPYFPYLIGNFYKSKPIEFNFKKESNQEEINLNETTFLRNVSPYNLLKDYSSYSYLNLPNNLSQTIDIKYASPGFIEDIKIIAGGSDYKVNDVVIFNNTNTEGNGASAKVSQVLGKQINSVSVATSSISDVEIYSSNEPNNIILYSQNPHNFKNNDTILISGLNTTFSQFNNSYQVGIVTNNLTLISSIGNVNSTGIITYFSVSGNLDSNYVRENDILGIGTEKVKILNIDLNSSRIRVLRQINNTVGSSHTASSLLYENSRKMTTNVGITSTFNYKVNKEIYFNPEESLGLGTIFGVGIGLTIFFSNPGVGLTNIFIPTKSIYIPNHKLETGDELTYNSNNGSGIVVSSGVGVGITLLNQSTVYVAKISNNLIGISTVKVGIGTTGTFVGIASTTSGLSILLFTGIGTGSNHSLKTNYPILTGKVLRNLVTVSTSEEHKLLNNDTAIVDVNVSISTTFVVKYNDYNRRLLINSRSFSSAGVNTVTNIINILNHGFKNSEKIIHISPTSSGGLESNKIYYTEIVDENNIKLSNNYFDNINTFSEIVSITSASSGSFSLINPPIEVYKNSTIIFDLSDSSLSYTKGSISYSAFKLEFYIDSNFTQKFESTKNANKFEINLQGSVGITSTAKVTININDDFPKKLFYKLSPIYENSLTDSLPKEKKEIIIDNTVLSNNQIEIKKSKYAGNYLVSIASSTSFTYTLPLLPEFSSYTPEFSILKYETNSKNTDGPISKIEIVNIGKNYYNLPGISDVISVFGKNSILEVSSKSIGKIQKTKINDIGYDFPCDFTIRPLVQLPQIVKIDPLSSFESIKIISPGKGYLSPPKLVVIDSKTDKIISDVDLKFDDKKSEITILKNTHGINNLIPTILPIQNSNGVGISSISYNSSTKNVTLILSVGFSTENSFPFELSDKVIIENISVGVESTGKGYNSSNYNYQLFTLNSVTPNIGGNGSVSYSLDGILNSNEFPGTFDPVNSSGRIIPQKYFPVFNILLKKNNFVKDEKIFTNSSSGNVGNWDNITNSLTIESKGDFEIGQIVIGSSSKTQGSIIEIQKLNSTINLKSNVISDNGWQLDAGFLNNNLQRLQDNFYYQNFSYSLKSRVSYDTWNEVVSTLNHTSGFKKFSDYQLESLNSNSLSIYNSSYSDVTIDFIEYMDLNSYYDFDLVKENSLTIGSNIFSNQITFSSQLLMDHLESRGNRVLMIDDFSSQFNSNPRSDVFSEVHRFLLSDVRSQKYIIYVRDKIFTDQRQISIVTTLNDNSNGYLNQYARVESPYDLGSFDFRVEGTEGILDFYPTRYTINDYGITTLSYNIEDIFTSIGSSNFGGIVSLATTSVLVSSGTTTTIVGIASTNRSLKLLVQIGANYGSGPYDFDEINLIHDGTDVHMIDYGQLTTNNVLSYSTSGLGTYNSYISGSEIKLDFIPNSGIGTTAIINAVYVSIASTEAIGIGSFDMKHARLESRSTSIAPTPSPIPVIIADYIDQYDCAYFMVQVSDITNNRHQFSEIIAVDSGSQTYISEFGIVETSVGIGTFDVVRSELNVTSLNFTPLPDIQTEVRLFLNALRYEDDIKDIVSFNNASVQTDFAEYYGTESDIKRAFDLKHKNYSIFERLFDATDSKIVNIVSNTIEIPNHYFVTGEEIVYSYPDSSINTISAIGIASTSFAGITTDKLPQSVYVIKSSANKIKLARSAEDALKSIPKVLNITSFGSDVGIGAKHKFTSKNQNNKVIIAIDNLIQSPIASTKVTTTLSNQVFTTDTIIYFSGITSFFSSDLIKIGDEIMKIEGIGIGDTNAIQVRRPWLGSVVGGYSTGDLVTKITGDYNITDNIINFVEAPYGNVPLGTTTNRPDERDWLGISVRSKFQGRTFLRSGISDSVNETYHKNYIFDDLSNQFNGFQKSFSLKSNGSNVTGISSENCITLINGVLQGPDDRIVQKLNYDFTLSESAGITSITFTGTATSVAYDVNNATIPRGGIIVSVGSTEGFSYQPLVSAGGTAIVSTAGTISLVSIGNSGSGYRSGVQLVKVGVGTYSTGKPNIEFIGTASVSNGHIIGISITNPGTGYTSTNPPYVIFDDPLSYSNIPLIYTTTSSGVGTEATIDIVIGQESNVIDFEIKNTGYGYGQGEILTIPIGGSVGIPTTSGFQEFQISIQKTFSDKFSSWSIGELQVLDNFDDLFTGNRVKFPISYLGDSLSIFSARGSNINVQDTLLIFVNDILQVPGDGYIFTGGSIITFTEPPKVGDTCKIIFYRGTGSVDVIDSDILETVKDGDNLTIGYDYVLGQSSILQEESRTVMSIDSADNVSTNPYFGPGNTDDPNLIRRVVWSKQTEDKIINGNIIGKSRILYEPIINPIAYLIQSVGIGSTIIYVDNIRPFFNPKNESDKIVQNPLALDFQNSITFISQNIVSGAAATAVVSAAGTISSVVIIDGGVGYSTATVSFGSTVGVYTTTQASGSVIISVGGTITGIAITNPGIGYTSSNPPQVLISLPVATKEICGVSSYSGDSGVIVGFGTTTQSSTNKLIFDFYIPQDSFLRNASLVSTAITLSSISVDDYFTVYNSKVGIPTISIDNNNNIIGFGTNFVDNVYQVDSVVNVSVANTMIGIATIGTATTTVRRVYARISGVGTINFSSTLITFDSTSSVFTFDSIDNIESVGSGFTGVVTPSNHFGNFSWGKIQLTARSEFNQFDFYGDRRSGGITTSTIVQRTKPLKFENYLI